MAQSLGHASSPATGQNGVAKAKGAMAGSPSRRVSLSDRGPMVDVYDTPASHAAARDMGMLGFSYGGRVFLGKEQEFAGAPPRSEVLRHELVHASQSARPGAPAAPAALEAQAHNWDGRAPLLSADPNMVYGWVWIPAVIAAGYILLKPETANAPAPGDPTTASMTLGDYAKMIGEAAVLSCGGVIYGALRSAGFSAVAAWGGSGAVGSISWRGISDVHGGDFSGVDTYVVDGFSGATIGIVTGGVFRLIGRIPGPTRAASNWFRRGAENDAAYAQMSLREKLMYEIGQKTLPPEQYAALEHMSEVERGTHLWNQSWWRALLPSSTGFVRPSGTLLTGPTPGGRALLRHVGGFSAGFGANLAFGEDVHDAYGLNGPTQVQGQGQDGGQAQSRTIIVVPQGRELEWLMKNNQLGDFPVPRNTPGIRTSPPPLVPGTHLEPVRGSGTGQAPWQSPSDTVMA